jgi:hypothetical protein
MLSVISRISRCGADAVLGEGARDEVGQGVVGELAARLIQDPRPEGDDQGAGLGDGDLEIRADPCRVARAAGDLTSGGSGTFAECGT